MFLIFISATVAVNAGEWSGNVTLEQRSFINEPLVSEQFQHYSSVATELEWYHAWDGRRQHIVFSPFIRVDQHDKERTHMDIRELIWLNVFEKSELRVGIGKVFWGVTESQHLVDVINQTDLVENMDGEDKLGQPMINYTMIRDWGTVDFFILPYFRERSFPGISGRLRTSLYVDTTNPEYESSKKDQHTDYAIRWSHVLGNWDIGLSYFNGTNREPSFKTGLDGDGRTVLRPVYNQVTQLGADLQATIAAWLWKLEVITRNEKAENFIASTAGFEYTFYGVFETDSDLGVVFEHLYDSRRKTDPPFADDLMLGLRWTANDEEGTTLLAGVISDNQNSSRIYSLEASRRIADNWTLNLEARAFTGIDNSTDPLYSFRKDDFVRLEFAYYF